MLPEVGADGVSSRIGERIFRIDHANRTDEPISLSHDRLKKPGPASVVTQRGAKLSHNVVDVFFGIDKQIGAPQPFHDLLARYHLLTAFKQKDQQLHGLLLDPDPASRSPQFVASQVDFDVAGTLL